MSSFYGITLEDFLEDQCGSAPTMLVQHYEAHRDWVEDKILEYIAGDPISWRDYALNMWLYLPELPDEWYYTNLPSL